MRIEKSPHPYIISIRLFHILIIAKSLSILVSMSLYIITSARLLFLFFHEYFHHDFKAIILVICYFILFNLNYVDLLFRHTLFNSQT